MAFEAQSILPHRGRPRSRSRRPGAKRVRRGLNLAIVLALGPSILMAVAGVGVASGLMDWSEGFAAFAAWASPRLALATIATGVLALVGAIATDFDRMWLRALLALSISATTLAGYVVSQAAPLVATAG
jgi:fatty-acyl-CoA synthase